MSAVIDHKTQQPIEPAVSKTTTALAVVTKSIEEINAVEATVAAIEKDFAGLIYAVDTTEGLEQARKDRATVREPRYALQKMQTAAKAPLNELKRAIDDQAGALIKRIEAVEIPIHTQVAGAELRKEQEKQARAETERKRVEAIEARITDIRDTVTNAGGRTSTEIAQFITELEAVAVDHTFAEFQQRAETAKAATLMRLRALHTSAAELETAQKQLAEKQAELAQQKAAEDLRQAQERLRLAEEERQAKVARDAETARHDAQLKRQRDEQEAEAARVKAVQDARDAEAAEGKRVYEAALGRVSAIHDQLTVAVRGREPDIAGGDVASFDQVIAETELWEITEQEFGTLVEAAERTKEHTLNTLKLRRAELVQRIADDAFAKAKSDKLAVDRAELARQQEALRLARESVAAPSDPAEATSSESTQASPPAIAATVEENTPPAAAESSSLPYRPSDDEIIKAVAQAFFVPESTAVDWIASMEIHQHAAAA